MTARLRMRRNLDGNREEIKMQDSSPGVTFVVLSCRTIRIGSHKYTPSEKVLISTKGIRIISPAANDPTCNVELQLQTKEIVKVLMHCGKGLPVIFIYTNQLCGQYVRKMLSMTDTSGPYYNPTAHEDLYRRITLLPNTITDENKAALKHIFAFCIDELNPREANEILVKTCPKEVQQTAKMITRANSTQIAALAIGKSAPVNSNEIRQILIYPRGKGGISINTEDYMCLAQDQFLNDIIIDFYLKYLCHESLSPQQREKTHVFSTFFYKRLTTKPNKANRSNPHEWDSSLTPAQKRHLRVKSWTKNVNIFEKDYVVVPINENCHWFLAIICFPGLDGCRSMLGDRLVLPQELKKKDRKIIHIGNAVISPMMKQEQLCLNNDGDNLSERDEAEAEESDLDMLGSESDTDEDPKQNAVQQKVDVELNKDEPIKQPCILIFDSLAGASRSRVVATLRDYLTCEYHAKVSNNKTFTKDTIKGSCPKIPQQNNFTDCGLYLLQYVEHFFKHPISDYRLPIKQLTGWFEEIVVTRKREEISELLKKLMLSENVEISLPDINFPTLNGKLLENNDMENGDNDGQSGDSTVERETASSRETTVSPRPISGGTIVSINQLINQTISSDSTDSASVRKTLRFSSEGQSISLPIKYSDKLMHIPDNLINNDKRQSDSNVSISSSENSETGSGTIFIKNKRFRNENDNSKKSKIAKY